MAAIRESDLEELRAALRQRAAVEMAEQRPGCHAGGGPDATVAALARVVLALADQSMIPRAPEENEPR